MHDQVDKIVIFLLYDQNFVDMDQNASHSTILTKSTMAKYLKTSAPDQKRPTKLAQDFKAQKTGKRT